MITNPQVGSVDNSSRQSTSVNGPTDGFRHILIGYARLSTADQNLDHQIDALLRAGVDRDNIHVDKASGAKASRPKLDLVLQLLCEGDTLKVTRLDRLSRSVLHFVTLAPTCASAGSGCTSSSRASTPPRWRAGRCSGCCPCCPCCPCSPSSSAS
nr:recombinase family protein [Streptomyces inhibens]